MQDWDDLRFFLAVARKGTVSGAAKQLAVNYSTVIRRINHLEEKAGTALFDRQPAGYELTPEGEDLLNNAHQIESEFENLERRIYCKDDRLSGTIRIDTTDHLAALLMDDYAKFCKAHPDIELQIMTNLEEINLAKREADIAIRFTNSPPEQLESRRVCDVDANIYASKQLLEEFEKKGQMTDYPWIGWDQNDAGGITARFIENFLPEGVSLGCRVNSGISLNNALRSGLGIGYMWCFVAEQYEELVKAFPHTENFPMGLWILLHKDMTKTRRLQVFIDFIDQALKEKF